MPRDRTLYGTPLVVDGIMYFDGSYHVLHAVDAATGQQLWEHDPRVIDHAGDKLRIIWGVSRGIAFYKRRIYMPTEDGRLIAVDAHTGRPVWSTLTVVLRGRLRANGMSRFPNLTSEDAENIRHYVRSMVSAPNEAGTL